jgi:CDGSH-type Zn-finger protein/uncharacterized Fe-S cluster protein YjdI
MTMSDQKTFTYPGAEIDVRWDQRLCIHVAECGQAKGDLFVAGREPWCLPDGCSRVEVREVVERCPSGALTYADKTGEPEHPPAENRVSVACNGPLFVTGDLAIRDIPADMPGVRYRAALCRCGRSASKPFCDNSHARAGFSDYGSVGERGAETGGRQGRLEITPLPDGPLLLSGPFTLTAGSGRTAWRGDQAALCRCGESRNKPFCDGSHKAAGFRSG